MDEQVYRFLPGGGLDLTVSDDRALDGNALRGGMNVRLVDREYWTREGEAVKRWRMAGVAAAVFISVDISSGTTVTQRHFAIGQWGVVELDSPYSMSCSIPYTPRYVGTFQFNARVLTVLVKTSGTILAGNLVVLGDPLSAGNNVYRVVSVSAGSGVAGTVVILDRTPTPTAAAVSIYDHLGDTDPGSQSAAFGVHRCSATIFRQRISWVAADKWVGGANAAAYVGGEESPPLTAGATYLVICRGKITSGRPDGPVAIRLDAVDVPKWEIMRKTSVAAGVAFTGPSPKFCEVYKGRLIIAREDPNSANWDRTVWYSDDGDMLTWHTGTVGVDATDNYVVFGEGLDPITGVKTLGDRLVIHREESQEVGSFTGSAITPIAFKRNAQGLGAFASKSIISIQGQHFIWTGGGPATFDGSQVSPISPGLSGLGAAFEATGEWAYTGNTRWPRAIVAAYHAARGKIWWLFHSSPSTDRTNDPISYSNGYADNGQHILVYEMESGQAMLHEFYNTFSIGKLYDTTSQEFVVASRSDGTLSLLCGTHLTSDAGMSSTADRVYPPAYVETKWHDFNSPLSKQLLRLQIELRTLPDSNATAMEYVTDAPAADAVLALRIWIFTDKDKYGTTGAADELYYDVEIDVAKLLARADTPDALRLPGQFMQIIPVRVIGEMFKLRIENFAGEQPFAVRISQITAWFVPEDTERHERV